MTASVPSPHRRLLVPGSCRRENISHGMIDQVEGTHLDRFRVGGLSVNPDFIDYEPAEQAIAATGADIRWGGEEAYYCRRTPDGNGDYICCPEKQRFPKEHEFYAVVLHELAHWSEGRLDWKGSYAEGELRAEIAAAFALTALGVADNLAKSVSRAYCGVGNQQLRDSCQQPWRHVMWLPRCQSHQGIHQRNPLGRRHGRCDDDR